MTASLRYQILCDGDVIGTSDFEERDESLGVAGGRFEPTAAYERVRHIFRLFLEAGANGVAEPDPAKLRAYEDVRATVVLAVHSATGKRLDGAGVVILDYSNEPDGSYEAEIYFATPRFFAQLAPLD